MRCWLIFVACGVMCLGVNAQEGGAPPPAIAPAGPIVDDGSIRDSVGFISVRPVPDAQEAEPLYFQRVEYLRKHHDDILAISYLRQLITDGVISSRERARAILELADCLDAQQQAPEALCWLKVWMELYPTRPEVGAVAYRIGALYTQMGLPDLARDAYYMTLAHSLNQGQVQSPEDLQLYTRLTTGTLWSLAANEYAGNKWARAAELFSRYRTEAPAASPISLEKAAYLQADCYYQLHQIADSTNLYEDTLTKHPFNPMAPQARLRLYHLYILQKQPEKARDDLQALAWTVRTVWPKEEAYWQKQTAQLLLALNQNNGSILPPLVQGSWQLHDEGKTWQELINHYDALVSYQVESMNAKSGGAVDPSIKAVTHHGLIEDDDLHAMSRYMDELLPPAPRTASAE